MKKLLLLMLLSSNIYAESCIEVPGDVIVKLSQVNNNPLIEYTVKVSDPYYPQADLFNLDIKACWDNECRLSTITIINPPQGYQAKARYQLINDKGLSKGIHNFYYKLSISRYACETIKEISLNIQ